MLDMSLDGGHPIKAVSQRTGLSQHAIRMWEKRYGAIVPSRTSTNRRRYSEDDVQRLILLVRAKKAGHSIGQLAQLPTNQLFEIIEVVPADGFSAGRAHDSILTNRRTKITVDSDPAAGQIYVARCLEAIEQIDATTLGRIFLKASSALGRIAVIDQVLVPVSIEVGERWRAGSLRVVHEHLASTISRFFLDGLRIETRAPTSAPRVVVTTPAGQMHELGALAVAATAATEGWQVTYLGPDLPAEEIVAAVGHLQAGALALSIVHPPDDPYLVQELVTLRRGLPPGVAIFAGGRSASAYQREIEEIGATTLSDLAGLRFALEDIRATKR